MSIVKPILTPNLLFLLNNNESLLSRQRLSLRDRLLSSASSYTSFELNSVIRVSRFSVTGCLQNLEVMEKICF